MPSTSRFVVALLLLTGLCVLGVRGLMGLPGIGGLLDPVAGVWGVAKSADLPDSAEGRIPGLSRPVVVLYDDRAVPHIFAESEPDVYRGLGYVVARDRLFQLELQTRAAAGTLTELLGPLALAADRETRQLGMPVAAERKLAAMDTMSQGGRMAAAYADGVNAYLATLSPDEYPIEYRILGKEPARWEPINSVHLFNRMGYILAMSSVELRRARAAARVGREAAEALFPANSAIQEPIQPAGRGGPRFMLEPLPPPGPPDSAAVLAVAALPRLTPTMTGVASVPPGEALGSNNWAVSPRRTESGYALLAGDPHLELSLPSLWYEAQLVVPGELDVYGVTLPGAPAIVIGFNRSVAWTFTNTESDVLDYWIETVDDSVAPTAYRLDDEWRPLSIRIEEYRGRSGELLAADTIRWSHRGPLRRISGRWLSMRWTLHEPVVEAERFIAAAHARSAPEFMSAMATFRVPAQNMLAADTAGTIAIRSTGWFPIRAGNGSGAELHDGRTTANDWTGFWPLDAYPQSVNPPQGYLASANQQPIDPSVSGRYLGADWYAPWRALRINALLRADSAVTPDAMRAFQTDPGSARADAFVPVLLASAARTNVDSVRRAAALLTEWSRTYRIDDQRAVLFEYTMEALHRAVWDELTAGEGGGQGAPPRDMALLALFEDSASLWWDRRGTVAIEDRDAIVAQSLTSALAQAVERHGEPDAGGWRWGSVWNANIAHLLRIPDWSANGVPVQGGPSTLSPVPNGGWFGASWRMVVELAPEVRAWGIYPGGQSGNPASARYRDRVRRWSEGILDTLRTPRTPDDLDASRVRSRLTLMAADR